MDTDITVCACVYRVYPRTLLTAEAPVATVSQLYIYIYIYIYAGLRFEGQDPPHGHGAGGRGELTKQI